MKDDLKTTKKLCEGDKITLKDYYSLIPQHFDLTLFISS